MVEWKDGELVTPAKVNEDGTIEPATYRGKTPLSAYNLNKMQSDLQEDADNKIESLSNTYKGSNIVGATCEGFGKIHKLFGKTEEVGSGEKSPSNPYEISCVANGVNLFDKNKLQIASTWQCNCTVDSNKKISIKVTATGGVAFAKTNALNLKAGTYTFSSKTEGQFSRIRILNSSDVEFASSETNNFTFTLEADTTINILFYVNNIALTNYLNIENIQIEKGSQATEYREYGEGSIKITSTDGTNTSNKVISCKPLCCLKDDEGNIVAQDYIDFDRQKIYRRCKRLVFSGDENWILESSLTNCLRLAISVANMGVALNSYGICSHLIYENNYNLDSPHFYIFNNHMYVFISKTIASTVEAFKNWLKANPMIFVSRSTNTEEDIDITNSIVQYQNETTISNSDNAEMEMELTNNKAISSINKNIGELQEKDNEINKTLESSNEVKRGTITSVAGANLSGGVMNEYSLFKAGKVVTLTMIINYNNSIPNTAVKVATIEEGFRPKKTLSFAIGVGTSQHAGWAINAIGYGEINTSGDIYIRNVSEIACRYAFINISYISE